MRRRAPLVLSCLVPVLLFLGAVAHAHPARLHPEVAIPPQNDPHQRRPPPRPPAGDAEARAHRLFDAIVHDQQDAADDFFFPREPFIVLKDISDPGRYFDVLLRHFHRDVHALHAQTPHLDRAQYVRFELARQMTWMTPGREGNHLPYWSAYHSFIHYTVDSRPRRIEVRVVITWGERWFVTHLM